MSKENEGLGANSKLIAKGISLVEALLPSITMLAARHEVSKRGRSEAGELIGVS